MKNKFFNIRFIDLLSCCFFFKFRFFCLKVWTLVVWSNKLQFINKVFEFIKKHIYKTLGNSVIYSDMSPTPWWIILLLVIKIVDGKTCKRTLK